MWMDTILSVTFGAIPQMSDVISKLVIVWVCTCTFCAICTFGLKRKAQVSLNAGTLSV